MARIFVTGSSCGLGRLAGEILLGRGQSVILHARDAAKAAALARALPAADVVTGDLETLAGMRAVASAAKACDAVIHNAAIMDRGAERITADGLPALFAVNVLAPYVLTALMPRPARLVYLSSAMHLGAAPTAGALSRFWRDGRWDGRTDYAQTKFLDTLLAFAIARLWPDVASNAVNPGWVPTRMGGASAPDDLTEGAMTQVLLAEGTGETRHLTGEYLHHRRIAPADPRTRDPALQDGLLDLCARISGVALPR